MGLPSSSGPSHGSTGDATLALLGGSPAFAQELHVGRPNLGDSERFLERVRGVLERRWLTNDGPLVRELEERVAERLGVAHCVAVCNATVGLELLVRGLDLTGEVIVPSFTFVATAHALQWLGLKPVFCDVLPATHNLDPHAAERLVSPATSAILGVHLWGRPCAIEPLETLARERGLALVFDASHAFGCSHRGRMLGGFGRAEVFSLHATKVLNALEGGVITTQDAALAERLRRMRNFGFTGYDRVDGLGTNAKMDEVSAAMALTGLDGLDAFCATNRDHYLRYRERLGGVAGLRFVEYDAGEANNYHYVVLEMDADAFGLTRDELVRVLRAENVLARRYFFPGCHRMEPYRTLYPEADRRLPATRALAERTLALPTGTALGPQDVDKVAALIVAAREAAPALRRRLRAEGAEAEPGGGR